MPIYICSSIVPYFTSLHRFKEIVSLLMQFFHRDFRFILSLINTFTYHDFTSINRCIWRLIQRMTEPSQTTSHLILDVCFLHFQSSAIIFNLGGSIHLSIPILQHSFCECVRPYQPKITSFDISYLITTLQNLIFTLICILSII